MWLGLRDVDKKYLHHPGKDVVLEVLSYTSYVLEALSGQRYTEQHRVTETLTPIPNPQRDSFSGAYMVNGQFYNAVCGVCNGHHVFKLRCVPAAHVSSVRIGDCTLDDDQYCLVDSHTLLVTGNRGTKPAPLEWSAFEAGIDRVPIGLGDGDLDLSEEEPPITAPPASDRVAVDCGAVNVCGTECITVSYICGSGVPAGGKLAARALAEEMLSGMTGGPCQLPERVTSVTRQGMTFTLLDPQDFLDKGRTGLYVVDLFLRGANPRGAMRPARVFIPTSRGRECGCVSTCGCGGSR
jgi:hypothetical protein